MGVVDQDRERLPLVERLEAARDAAGAGQREGGLVNPGTPRAWQAPIAASAFSTLKWPGNGIRTSTSPPGPRHRKVDPAASNETSVARKSAPSAPAREKM